MAAGFSEQDGAPILSFNGSTGSGEGLLLSHPHHHAG